jgi:hypothetical protein
MRANCTPMFNAIAKLWNQPRCPTTYLYIKKMKMKNYLTIKKIMLFAGKWMEL